MKIQIHIVFLFIAGFCLIMFSCSYNFSYKSLSRKTQVIQKEYTKDTLFFKDAVVCHVHNNRNAWQPKNTMIPVNQDSVLSVFSESIHKLGLPIARSVNVSCDCDTAFHYTNTSNRRQEHIQVDKLPIANIISSNYKKSKHYILPVIYIVRSTVNRGYLGVAEFYRVYVFLYIVKNNFVEYSKFSHYTSEYINPEYDVDENKRPTNPIQQKHWDKLVELVMRDYIKRLK